MPPGRPPLDPDLKKQHLRESRRRYEEKNAVQRRSAAHLRMQRHRNSIASSDIITRRKHARKVAVSSNPLLYNRKNEKDCANQRAADAARKDIRDHELQALRQRHTPTPKPPPCTHSRKFTLSVPPPIAQPAAVTKPPNRPQRPPSSPSSLSDSVISCQSSTTSSALLSPRHTPVLSPPPSPSKSRAKLTKDELALLASFRPGPGPISPQRLKQQFERALGPQAVATPSSQHAAQEGNHSVKNLRISLAMVEATMRAGGRVLAKQKPSVDLEQPQTPPSMLRTKREEHRPSSHEAAQSARALDHPESRHVGESFNSTIYAVSGQNRIFKDRDCVVDVFKNTPSADLLFTRDERELFNFLAEDVSDMRI
ncbi:hypothetical protein DFH08DRAFT_963084 [Mycena albidolilacea]|uniref:Uncharacterized protein n=1 Tax=Mycena albidolilacea TaxID=1033008 RepID=A0AAD7EPE2_9AGAR|nr:hypothetical protein DFH08DRAFT_963084 [Mycena albidolilacea]